MSGAVKVERVTPGLQHPLLGCYPVRLRFRYTLSHRYNKQFAYHAAKSINISDSREREPRLVTRRRGTESLTIRQIVRMGCQVEYADRLF